MKIITWNINGLRSILGQNPSKRYDKIDYDNKLFDYIYKEKPDIICLQETKATEIQIDEQWRCPSGYLAYYNSCQIKKGYSGVLTFTKLQPKTVKNGIGNYKYDSEGRITEINFDDFVLFNIYFPSGTSGRDRVDYKLEFYDAVFDYIDRFKKRGRKIIISGDYNTAHKEIDLARPKENENNSGFLPEERAKLDWMIANGYVDIFRDFNQNPGQYTWWSQRGSAREKNIGWRIDYHFITKNFEKYIKNVKLQPDVQGSDHCPVLIEINL